MRWIPLLTSFNPCVLISKLASSTILDPIRIEDLIGAFDVAQIRIVI